METKQRGLIPWDEEERAKMSGIFPNNSNPMLCWWTLICLARRRPAHQSLATRQGHHAVGRRWGELPQSCSQSMVPMPSCWKAPPSLKSFLSSGPEARQGLYRQVV